MPADTRPDVGDRPNGRRYTSVAQHLHWITAAGVFALIAIAWIAVSMAEQEPHREFFLNLHKSLGLTVWLLICGRLVWRFGHPAPPLASQTSRWVQTAGSISHWLLYLLFFLMPLAGFTASSAGGYGVHFWGIPLPELPHNDGLAKLADTAHVLGSYVVYALIALHLAATAWHVVVRRDGTLQRMIPPQLNAGSS